MKRIILILFIIIMFAAMLIILCGCGQSGTNIATDNSVTTKTGATTLTI